MQHQTQRAYCTTTQDVTNAARRIAPHIHRTPVLQSRSLNHACGCNVFVKCENLQRVGAFKIRGAMNAVLRLANNPSPPGVITHSSGNHAQALACAAGMRNIPAHVVMPSDAPAVKRTATEGYGATVYSCEPSFEARIERMQAVKADTGAVFIPPFDHPDIIAGQGTLGLELVDDIDDLEAIIAPIGGGGMISGISIATSGNTLAIIGAEPTGADDAARALNRGEYTPMVNPNTIADGLRTSLGQHTWPIIRDHVDHVITVSDDQIVNAMRFVWERMKMVIEPSAAVTIAALMYDRYVQNRGFRQVAAVISGGNVDLERLPWLP